MSQSDPSSEASGPPDLTMTLDMNILQHLGLKMYTSLPAVISEYVANAWDAGATEVDITVPQESVGEDYEITIEDNGIGMDYEDVDSKFLVVGRNRREVEGEDVVEVRGMKRKVMGRKGIGKLAGFGVAGKVRVRTFSDHQWVEFELDYEAMKEEGNEDDPAETSEYDPRVVDWGNDGEKEHGTIVTLADLERERQPTLRYIKERLARRFAVIDEDFVVKVNDEPIEASDRGLRSDCEEVWELEDTIEDSQGKEYGVEGWIGALDKPVDDDDQKGIAVMARGKLVQEPNLFDTVGSTSGQFDLEYLVGEVHADFVDDDELDLISTDRSSLAWGKEPASQLYDWIHQEIIDAANEWGRIRTEKRVEEAKNTESWDSRITNLPEEKQEEIEDFVGQEATNRDFDEGEEDPFIEKVAESAEREVFTDFIQDMREVDVSEPGEVIDLMHQWEVLDALELMQVARGRLETITKFRLLIETDARNEAYVHEFISDNPWVLEPRWDYVDDEPSYSMELREEFPTEEAHDDPQDRLSLMCLGYGETLNIVEVLRPGDTIERRHLENLERYVDFLRDAVAERDDGYRGVDGYVIGGDVSRPAERKADRLEGDELYARTYERMQHIAENTFDQFLDVFEQRAEDTGDERLLIRVEELRQGVP